MRGILAHERLGRVDRRLALTRLVVGVDEIQPALPCLVRERESGRQRLVGLDGVVEVVRAQL